MITDRSFANMFARTEAEFKRFARKVHTARWQGQDVSKRPDMVSYELLNWRCEVGLDWMTMFGSDHSWSNTALLGEIAKVIKPNLPWADEHFLERVGGEPLNPGVQWAHWPWASSADKHRVAGGGQFNHTYMERLWPKFAGEPWQDSDNMAPLRYDARRGIRWKYGDLDDLVELLANEPDTRQAWIPLFFPEDTGIGDGGRKPCTLGYQIIVRDKAASIYYPLRSCDYVRHFRDDIYLALRLLLWVIDRCRELNPAFWGDVVPGYYAMHATSLHIFENDYRQVMGDAPGAE